MGKSAHTGTRIVESGKIIIAVPGMGSAEAVTGCGSTSGKDTDKASKFGVDLKDIPGGNIKIPIDTKLAFAATLNQAIEVGGHCLCICNVDKIYGDKTKEALFAWNGYSKTAPAREKLITKDRSKANDMIYFNMSCHLLAPCRTKMKERKPVLLNAKHVFTV